MTNEILTNIAQTAVAVEEVVETTGANVSFGMIALIVIYLAVVAFLGYRGYKGTKTSADYMLGGRNIHPFIMALSYGATFISTSAIIGFGGLSSVLGMSLLWLAFLNILVGIFIAFVLFGKRTRRMGLNLDAHTFPELIGRRYNSKFIQWFAGIVIFILMPLYTTAVLLGGARVLEALLGVPIVVSIMVFAILVAAYVFFGGLKGVMFTDALQGTLMFVGMLVLVIFIYSKVGGVVEGHKALTVLGESLGKNWTTNPPLGSSLWWVIYSSIVLGVGVGVLAQPQLIVRYMSVKSDKELNRAVLLGGVFIMVAVGTTYVLGPLSNVYFFQKYGQTAVAFAGGVDSVVPAFIYDAMPTWFSAIFLLVILSAAMSTLSSQFHAIGTSVGRDFYETLSKKKDDAQSSFTVTRVGILITLLITILLSLLTKDAEGGIIARATAIFFGIMAAGFLAPYSLGIFWKKATRKGAITGILSGILVSAIMFIFFHTKEAAIFGVVSALTDGQFVDLYAAWMKNPDKALIWGSVDPLVFSLPVSFICTIVVSLFTKVENPEIVEKSFVGISKK